jgi:hypothetical protein
MNENIKAGADIHAGDGGYSEGTRERYEAFVMARNYSIEKERTKMEDERISAFPVSDMQSAKPENIDELKSMARGMTLRDYFAIQVLPAIYKNYANNARSEGWDFEWRKGLALDAYKMADAMMEARK